MSVYRIINVGANKYLTISGSNLLGTQLYENKDVTMQAYSSSGGQIWIVPQLSGQVYIRSYLNRTFGLNVYGSGHNCDIHTIVGNENDALISFTSTSSGFRICLVNHNLYLTADSSGRAYWATLSGSTYQLWSFVVAPVIESGSTTTIYSKVGTTSTASLTETQRQTNAKYIFNFLKSKGFTAQAACAVLGNFEQESGLNPGIWQSNSNTSKGYGIAQWTQAKDTFLQWAVDVGLITSITAANINSVSNSQPQKLMDAELSYFIWTLDMAGGIYIPTTSMTLSQFKQSTQSAANLSKIFCDDYERAGDPQYSQRANYATKWYNYLA